MGEGLPQTQRASGHTLQGPGRPHEPEHTGSVSAGDALYERFEGSRVERGDPSILEEVAWQPYPVRRNQGDGQGQVTKTRRVGQGVCC